MSRKITYVQKKRLFTRENDILSTQNNFLAANIQSNSKLLCKIPENKHIDPMQTGKYTILPSGHRAQAYFSLMKQIHVPRTNVVKKKRTAFKT